MGFIYKITNIQNGKIYIGQTKYKVQNRWKQHLYESNNKRDNNKFHNAIRKYGEKSFDINIIEEVDNSLLSEREIYYISLYDSYKNGYNSTLGGECGKTLDIDCDLVLLKHRSGLSISRIAKTLHITPRSVRNILKCFGIKNKCTPKDEIVCISKDLKSIKMFDSKYQAFIWYTKNDNCAMNNFYYRVNYSCKEHCTSFGYYWMLLDDFNRHKENLSSVLNLKTKSGKPLKCIELDYIFKSLNDAAKYCISEKLTSSRSYGSISKAISKAIQNNEMLFGYNWEYV